MVLPDLHSDHLQWAKATGCEDGIVRVEELDTILYKFRGVGVKLFRGEHNFYETFVRPCCFRDGKPSLPINCTSNLTEAEDKEIRRFRWCHPSFILRAGWSGSRWLSLAQHYSGKTRLVDVSYDYLVGLFFACWDFDEKKPPVDSDNNGWLYILMQGNFRRMTMPRDQVEQNSGEQGISNDYRTFFDPSETSAVQRDIVHLYRPYGDRSFNARMSAQRGAFVWWHPPHDKIPAQVIPVPIRSTEKLSIIRSLRDRGVSAEVLFPDKFGQSQRERLSLM